VKRKALFFAIAIIVIGGLLAAGCNPTTTTTTTTTRPPTTTTTTGAPPPTTTTTRTTTTTTPPTTGPEVHGGILRMIAATGPTAFGGPLAGPFNTSNLFPGQDSWLNASSDRSSGVGLEPSLCSSVEEDIANQRLVYHIRPGVKFHDGSELTADVGIWNFQRAQTSGLFWGINLFEGFEKIDNYTFAIKYNQYTNLQIQNWGWGFPLSKAHFDANVADPTSTEQVNNYLANNMIGTGPFKIQEFVKDSHLYWTKFDDYWQKDKGLPYLDGIQVRYIPDSVTARALMEAGQADYWLGAPALDLVEMKNAGFEEFSGWAGLVWDIWPNTADPNSIWNDLNLRLALDYALDKAALAKALGFGIYKPLYQLAPPGEWGYDPSYPERKYDPAKARELVAAAGYPNGVHTTLITQNNPAAIDQGNALKGYLDAANILVDLKVVDYGLYSSDFWVSPEPDSLIWGLSGMDNTHLLTYLRWFSSDPFANARYLGRSEEQKPIDDRAKAAPTVDEQRASAMEAFKWMNDNARITPVYLTPAYTVGAPYVHSTYGDNGLVRWQTELTWMEPH
jgi:peptide/nickel transport system substrate-binding protein